jgi:hypothetical protein
MSRRLLRATQPLKRRPNSGIRPRIGARMIARSIPLIPLFLAIAGCASSSQLLTGVPHSAVLPTQVRVYTMAPPKFEEIAVLGASRKSVSTAGGERAIAKMIESMRGQAAQLGANGLLLEDFSDSDPVSVGTGFGSQTYTHNASISLGVGGSLGVVNKAVKARAIFVAP